jgi:hypothetical protein
MVGSGLEQDGSRFALVVWCGARVRARKKWAWMLLALSVALRLGSPVATNVSSDRSARAPDAPPCTLHVCLWRAAAALERFFRLGWLT